MKIKCIYPPYLHFSVEWTLSMIFVGILFFITGFFTPLHFFFHITVDVFEELIAFNLLSKTVRIFKDQLCTISIFRFDKVVVKFVHQRFADIEDAHCAIDRLSECQLRSLHVDFHRMHRRYASCETLWIFKIHLKNARNISRIRTIF